MGCAGSTNTSALSMVDDSMALNKARLQMPERSALKKTPSICDKDGSIFDDLPDPRVQGEDSGAESSEEEEDKLRAQRRGTRCRTKFLPKDLSASVGQISKSVTRLRIGMERACRTIADQVDHIIDGHAVVLFSKTVSDDSHKVWSALADSAAMFTVVEVEKLLVGDVNSYCNYLEEKTGISGGLPCMFIRGTFIGGAGEIDKLLRSGKLTKLCKAAGAPEPSEQPCKSTSMRKLKREERRKAAREARDGSSSQGVNRL